MGVTNPSTHNRLKRLATSLIRLLNEYFVTAPEKPSILAIKETIKGYWDAYNLGQYSKCLTYCTGVEDEEEEEKRLALGMATMGKITLRGIEDVKIENSKATAMVITIVRGKTGRGLFKLVKQQGKWKIRLPPR